MLSFGTAIRSSHPKFPAPKIFLCHFSPFCSAIFPPWSPFRHPPVAVSPCSTLPFSRRLVAVCARRNSMLRLRAWSNSRKQENSLHTVVPEPLIRCTAADARSVGLRTRSGQSAARQAEGWRRRPASTTVRRTRTGGAAARHALRPRWRTTSIGELDNNVRLRHRCAPPVVGLCLSVCA